MALENPDAVLAKVQERIIAQSAARGRDVSGWFQANAAGLSLVARLLANLANRAGFDPSGPASASSTARDLLADAEKLVGARNPAKGEWFARNRKFLALVATMLFSRPIGPASARRTETSKDSPPDSPTPSLPPDLGPDLDESDPSRSAERTTANLEALQVLARLLAEGRIATPQEIANPVRAAGVETG